MYPTKHIAGFMVHICYHLLLKNNPFKPVMTSGGIVLYQKIETMYTNASFTHFRQKQVKHMRTSKVNSKCTLVCRHLVLRWKISSNKICRSQREQVRTSSTILFQISNFDSKLHLKRRYFLLITKTLEFWSADSTRKWYCQSISDW